MRSHLGLALVAGGAVGAVLAPSATAVAESLVSYDDIYFPNVDHIHGTQRNITLDRGEITWRFDSWTNWAGDDWAEIAPVTCSTGFQFGDGATFTGQGTWKHIATEVLDGTCFKIKSDLGWDQGHHLDYTIWYNHEA
jgi:hypothetical protein